MLLYSRETQANYPSGDTWHRAEVRDFTA